MPDVQRNAGRLLYNDLKARYPNAVAKRHKDLAPTACPGNHFPSDFIFSAIVPKTEMPTLYLKTPYMERPEVATLQKAINAKRIRWPWGTYVSLVVDGEFGPKTDKAVRRYQTLAGLGVDGIVGNKTWTALGY
jgi:hypothetical protein